jgi:uncharacterized membrane protein
MHLVLRRAFIAASIAWALLLALVPFLASRAHASALGTAIVIAGYGIGSLVCHQLPRRSYQLWSAQMPVCARCAGIYLGAAAAAVVSGVRGLHASGRSRLPGALALRHARVAAALAAVPTAITLIAEWITGTMPPNTVRFAAGLPIGIVVAWLVVSVATDQVN